MFAIVDVNDGSNISGSCKSDEVVVEDDDEGEVFVVEGEEDDNGLVDSVDDVECSEDDDALVDSVDDVDCSEDVDWLDELDSAEDVDWLEDEDDSLGDVESVIVVVEVDDSVVVVVVVVDVDVVVIFGEFGSMIDISAQPKKFSCTTPQPTQLVFVSESNP